jgi:predicted chitinase
MISGKFNNNLILLFTALLSTMVSGSGFIISIGPANSTVSSLASKTLDTAAAATGTADSGAAVSPAAGAAPSADSGAASAGASASPAAGAAASPAATGAAGAGASPAAGGATSAAAGAAATPAAGAAPSADSGAASAGASASPAAGPAASPAVTGAAGAGASPAAGGATSAAAGAAATTAAGASGAASTGTGSTATGSAGSGGGKVNISKDEFTKAVTDCYPAATGVDKKYDAFMKGLNKSKISSKKEAAMFLAQILHESGGLIYTAEIKCKDTGCPGDYPLKAGVGKPGKTYFGRGYIQLTWDYNYDKASKALYSDSRLLDNPEQVATNDEYSWAVSFWFWDANVHDAPGVQQGKFGAATNAINGPLECVQKSNPTAVQKRNDNYAKCLKDFGINDTPDTSGC